MKIHRVLYYLLLFFLPTQLGLHTWPAWSYVLGRRIDYLSPTIYLTDVLIFFMLLFWFFESYKRVRNYIICLSARLDSPRGVSGSAERAGKAGIVGKKKRLFPVVFSTIRHTKTITVFFLFVFVNTWVARNQPVAVYGWIKVVEFFLFFYYIKKTAPPFINSSLVFLLSMTYTSAIAIVQFAFQHSIGGIFWFLGERTFDVYTPGIARFDWCGLFVSLCRPVLRPYATFPHPNVLAGFIVVLLPAFIYLMKKKTKELPILPERMSSFVIPAIIFISIVTLVLTFSRSALLVGFIMFCFYLFLDKENKRKTNAVLVLVILCISIAFHVIGKQLSLTSESVTVRQDLNTNALALWKTSPLFGIGLKNAIVSLPSVMHTKHVYFLQPTHNIYLLALAETGVAGATFFLWIILKTFGRLRDQTNQKSHTVVLIKTLSFISLLLLGVVDHYPLTIQQGQLLFAYIIGMSYMES